VLDTVFAGPAYAWVQQGRPLESLTTWWRRFSEWLSATRDTHPTLFQGLTLLLSAVLVGILAHAAYVFLRTLRGGSRRDGGVAVQPTTAFWRDAASHLRAADQAAAAGRFREALGLAFEALVLRLDEAGVVRWGPGKTARDYAREARLPPAEQERLGGLVGLLYRCVYGGAACGPDEYRAVRVVAEGE
jgi:hypothetical protein